MKDKEEECNGTKGTGNKEESARVSPEATKREAAAALTTFSTPIKQKGKRHRQTPLYFRTRKITRIRQGKPQTSSKLPIVIEYPLHKNTKCIPLSPLSPM